MIRDRHERAPHRRPSERFARVLADRREAVAVETDPGTLASLEPCLEARGYRLRVLRDPRRAVEALAVRPPALVIANLDAPPPGGLHLIERLRAAPATRALPIVLLSSRDDLAAVERALTLGVPALCRRPVERSHFLAELVAIEVAAHPPGAPPIRGRLEETSTADLACALSAAGRSALLEAQGGGVRATLRFDRGRPAYAGARGARSLLGDAAATRLLRIRSGWFEVSPDPAPGPHNITRPLPALLLEAARRAAQSRRSGPALPSGGDRG